MNDMLCYWIIVNDFWIDRLFVKYKVGILNLLMFWFDYMIIWILYFITITTLNDVGIVY